MRDILVLCPQERDLTAIEAARLAERYRIHFAGSDLDQIGPAFDPLAFVAECVEIPADGVIGSKDRSALLASLVASRRGLPGPDPGAILACQHKPTSRSLQALAAPEAVPGFALLDARPPRFGYPFFVKPVVGRLSQNAMRIDGPGDLLFLHEADWYTTRYGQIAELAGFDSELVHGFLAEELLTGDEVTYEGYVHGGRVTTIGVTDSVKYPGTNSFERFEYPTVLSEGREAELEDVVKRVMPELGLDGGFFNVEFFVSPGEAPRIIEVNARIASQFAPIVQALHGRSTYDALFELACGDDPGWRTGRPNGVGVSYCMRVFEDAFVEAVPDPEDGFELLVRPGLHLSDQGVNDAQSYRLFILNEIAETRAEAVRRCRERARRLRRGFRLAPLPVR
jgi:hypothetical protein